jgi:hypothetical protein
MVSRRASLEDVPNEYFWTGFRREAVHEAHFSFHWQEGAIKRSFDRLPQEEAVSPKVFENGFSFTREAASRAVLGEAEAMTKGVL